MTATPRTPVYTTTVNSTFFNRPSLASPTAVSRAGQTYTYRLYVTDPFGQHGRGRHQERDHHLDANPSPYAQTRHRRRARPPTGGWVRHPAARPTTGRASPTASSALALPAARRARSSATATPRRPSTAPRTARSISHPSSQAAPNTFSIEAWFKTTSTTGGKIVGFGDTQDRRPAAATTAPLHGQRRAAHRSACIPAS